MSLTAGVGFNPGVKVGLDAIGAYLDGHVRVWGFGSGGLKVSIIVASAGVTSSVKVLDSDLNLEVEVDHWGESAKAWLFFQPLSAKLKAWIKVGVSYLSKKYSKTLSSGSSFYKIITLLDK